jgi:hypothetical protein
MYFGNAPKHLVPLIPFTQIGYMLKNLNYLIANPDTVEAMIRDHTTYTLKTPCCDKRLKRFDYAFLRATYLCPECGREYDDKGKCIEGSRSKPHSKRV